MKKKITESLEMHVVATAYNLDVLFKNAVSVWRGLPYAELSTLLGYLTFLDRVHHTHHWISQSDPFYGDHLLFQRLYETTSGEIDALAEKAVGLGSRDNVDISVLCKQVNKWTSLLYVAASTIPSSSELAKRSLDVELAFLKYADMTAELLRETGMLTRGLDNNLAGMADVHEGHVFLLKQRITNSSQTASLDDTSTQQNFSTGTRYGIPGGF